MDLTFGDLLANALADIKEYTGKKIGILQDEISYVFEPPLSNKTIESWRYRQAPPTIEQLETLAEAILGYGHPQHDSRWLFTFLNAANHPYAQAVCDRLFPLEEETETAYRAQFAPPPLAAYAPPQNVDFIGRTHEAAHLRQLLSQNKIAIISGMAGVGKTSVAAFLASESPANSTFWHDFRDANIQSLIVRLAGFLAHHKQTDLWEMLEAARLTKSNPPDLTIAFDILAAQMSRLALLLCFDDFHHVETNPSLQLFLQRITAVKNHHIKLLIITRRNPAFLTLSTQAELRGFAPDEARRFLEQRGVSLAAELMTKLHEVTGGNATLLTLAAAALHGTQHPSRLIEQLAKVDDIERFLMVEVNDHLPANEQRVMEAIAILKGYPATRSFLEFVLDGQDIRRPLRGLEDQFLVMVNQGNGVREYQQHQIIQAFYFDQPRADQRLTYHKKAAAYFSQVAFSPFMAVQQYALGETAVPTLQTAKDNLWAIVNEGQAASLLPILENLPPSDFDPPAQLDRLILCSRLSLIIGDYAKAQDSLTTAVAALNNLPDSEETNTLKAQVYLAMAERLERDAPAEALSWLQRGLALVPDHETQLIASLKIMIGTVNMHMGNFGEALEMFHDGLDDLPTAPSPQRVNALKNLGAVYFNTNQLAQAQDYSTQALEMSRRLHDHFQTARIYINLGPINYVAGDWQGALDDLEKGLAIAQRLGAADTILSLHTNLGSMYVERGDHEQAFKHLNTVLQLAGEQDRHQVITAKIRLAQLYNYEGKWDTAVRQLQEAEELARHINDQASLATILGYQATACLGSGQLEEANALIQEALKLDRALGYYDSMAENLRIAGTIAAARHDREAAAQAFSRSLEIWQPLDPYQAALTRLSWGAWLGADGDSERGKAMLAEALQQFEALGALREIELSQKLLDGQ